MNNQNYRQNLRNPAGKPSADEPPQTQAESRKQEQPSNSRQNGPGQGGYRPGGLRFPIGNQQPYHAGPQPGSQQGGQTSQNGPQQSGQASQNGPQQAGQTPQNAFQQGNQTFQNDSRQNSQSFQNGSRQNTPPFRNGSQQGSRPFQNDSQQGNPAFQNGSQQGNPAFQNAPQQNNPAFQNGSQPFQGNAQGGAQGGGPGVNSQAYQSDPRGNTQQYQSGPQQTYGQYQQNTQQQGNFQDNWMNNPNLKGMDPEKLKMLNNIANQGSQKGMNELLPFLMSAVSQNKSQSGGLDFSRQEMDTIIEVLKMGKPPEEVARINRMMQIIKMMH